MTPTMADKDQRSTSPSVDGRKATPPGVAHHPATLRVAAASGLTLEEALRAAAMDGGCALLTAPSAYRIAMVTSGGCVTKTGEVDLSQVYDARVFTPDAELRWQESGSAVLLAENDDLLPGSFTDWTESLAAQTTLEARYLVWGTARAVADGWATLTSARVGAVTVPVSSASQHSRMRLIAREYVVTDPAHGNAYVAEERLLRFEPYAAEGDA